MCESRGSVARTIANALSALAGVSPGGTCVLLRGVCAFDVASPAPSAVPDHSLFPKSFWEQRSRASFASHRAVLRSMSEAVSLPGDCFFQRVALNKSCRPVPAPRPALCLPSDLCPRASPQRTRRHFRLTDAEMRSQGGVTQTPKATFSWGHRTASRLEQRRVTASVRGPLPLPFVCALPP